MDMAQLRQLMAEQLRLSRRQAARIRELEDDRHAPVAVVGMGLRLPADLSTPQEYWEFLGGEGLARQQIPADRPGLRAVYDPVPGRPGRSYVDKAGFLSDIAHFDADFFGISQREAELLDPQQRILLEVAWEALERAGIPVRRSDRLNVGVFLGMMASEYGERLEGRADKTPIDPYYATGGGLCFGAGRISFVMGFSGPVVSVDTACSSSLVALHLATRALRNRECRYALVCGSNLLISSSLMISLAQSRALAPDGRSKSFLASADGYGRGEGVGVLVLMRQDDAEAAGQPIQALVRGTAINHDGAASGLTVPSGPAQTEVIRSALADAQLEADQVGWVEAHGTGTLLGDPIEVGALNGALGEAVRARGVPLGLGSVKSRLGHLEAASGVASLIKTVLMLQHGVFPAGATPSDELNPHIPWQQLGFEVPRQAQAWPAELPRRVAGVNSFGMSGTNAHAVLEAYPPAPDPRPAETSSRTELLTISARNSAALLDLGQAVRRYLKALDPALTPSACHTLRAGRVAFGERVAVVGASIADLDQALADALDQVSEGAGSRARATGDGRLRGAELRLGADRSGLEPAVQALTAAFPLLAPAAADPDPAPAGERLIGLLSRLGLPVTVSPTPAAGLADLTWGTGPQVLPALPAAGAGDPVATFLAAVGALFTAGADLWLDGLRAPGARLLPDLPTYPFQRKRFWIEEFAADQPVAIDAGHDDPAASRVPGPADTQDRALVEAYLMAELMDALRAEDELDVERSFLESGGDSFISNLYMSRVEERFELGLTPDDINTDMPLAVLIGRIADHIVNPPGAVSGPGETVLARPGENR